MPRQTIPRPPWLQHPALGQGDTAPGTGAAPAGQRPTGAPADPPQPHVGHLDELAAAFVSYLSHTDHGRGALADSLWAKLAAYVEEFGADMTGGAQQIVVQATRTELFKVTALIAIVPGGVNAAGTLTLGSKVYPLPGGVTQWNGLQLLLQPSEKRQLTSVNAGNMCLHLMGEIVPTRGRVT